MEIIPASCDYDISLINITLMNESAPGMYVLAIPYLANGFIQKHIQITKLTNRQNWVSDWLGLKQGPPLYILLSLKWNGHSIWWLLPLCSSYRKQLQQTSRVYSNEVYALFFHLCSLPLCSFMHYCFVRSKEYILFQEMRVELSFCKGVSIP